MKQVAIKAVERILNHCLRLDKASIPYWQACAGSRIKVELQPCPGAFYIHCVESGVELQHSSTDEGAYDVSLKGPLVGFLRFIGHPQPQLLLNQGVVQLHGDVRCLQQLQNFMAQFDPDYEAKLAHWIGGYPAYLLVSLLGIKKAYWARAKAQWIDNTRDYLHYEHALLPHPDDVEDQYNQIEALVLQMDRLQARVQRLTNVVST